MTVEPVTNRLQQRVQHERRIRGWSIRRAAQAGAMSNTTWGVWESSTDAPTNTIRQGVAKAFDWALDWPEDLPPIRQHGPDEPTMAELSEKLDLMLEQLDRMGAALETLTARVLSGSTRPGQAGRTPTPAAPRTDPVP